MTIEEKKLLEEEKQREKELKQFLILLSPLLLNISDVRTYIEAKNLVQVDVDRFVNQFKVSLSDSMYDELSRIAPHLTVSEKAVYVESFFAKTYKLKKTNKLITLDDIIYRRGEQFKDSIFNKYSAKYGFNSISGNQLKTVIDEAYKSNKANFTRIQVTELHNAQIEASKVRGDYLKEKGVLLGYQYTTAGDHKVRHSHTANAGFWSADRVDKEGVPSTLSEVHCRCSFVPVTK